VVLISVNGGVKVYHLAEQKCTTTYLYSQDRPGEVVPLVVGIHTVGDGFIV
jgi:hypothetical protein